MFFYILLFAILIYLFILVGTHDYNKHLNDQEVFANDYYLVDKNNVFKNISVVDAHIIASGKKGIIFFGNKGNIWSQYYAQIINDVAKNVSLEEIYYYDFFPDREQKNGTYEDILNLLKDYLIYNDKGKPNIYAPSLLVINEGQVLYYDFETSFMQGNTTPEEYWTKEKLEAKKDELEMVFLEYLGVI